ncbi:DUF1848 domain-containing protein [Aestuariispira insulae]|nr:DUF1848 domain-containing protein [Aestuariispira insulae]
MGGCLIPAKLFIIRVTDESDYGAVIVSASYRTDIPAFYAPWFLNRLRACEVFVKNPYGGRDYRVSLAPDDVDGVVFWTRNMAPLMAELDLVREVAPFIVQFTMTNYPRALETSVIAADRAIADMRALAGRFGARSVVWRYDPVVVTDLTPPEWHLENFAGLAARMEGVTDEVVLSFVHLYSKTKRNMDQAARSGGFGWRDPEVAEKRSLLAKLAGIAKRHGMAATLCSQPDLLADGMTGAACIDANRLADLGGQSFKSRQKGNRAGCLCAESRDIGRYDSCPHGCAYCYATRNRATAKKSYAGHNEDIICL